MSEAQLTRWAEKIGQRVATPALFALRGELGAGKSVFARGVARGAGVDSPMPSPTFNLLYEYRVRQNRTIRHLDLYRLEDQSEVWELAWRELGLGDEIVLIEWPERAETLLPQTRWDVMIEAHPDDALRRLVTLFRIGDAPELPVPAS